MVDHHKAKDLQPWRCGDLGVRKRTRKACPAKSLFGMHELRNEVLLNINHQDRSCWCHNHLTQNLAPETSLDRLFVACGLLFLPYYFRQTYFFCHIVPDMHNVDQIQQGSYICAQKVPAWSEKPCLEQFWGGFILAFFYNSVVTFFNGTE